MTDVRKQILEVLARAEKPLAPREISDLIEGSTYDSVRKTLRRMLDDNQVGQDSYGSYTLPERVTVTPPTQASAAGGAGQTGKVQAVVLEEEGQVVYLPVMAMSASAGNGNAHVVEHTARLTPYDKSELYRMIRANPNDVFTMPVEGDSMKPIIPPGTLIFVQRAASLTNFSDGVYVFRLEEAIYVKVVQRLPGRKLRIVSYNPIYVPFEVELADTTDFELIGKVVMYPERL